VVGRWCGGEYAVARKQALDDMGEGGVVAGLIWPRASRNRDASRAEVGWTGEVVMFGTREGGRCHLHCCD
jgi:hypothetical protein